MWGGITAGVAFGVAEGVGALTGADAHGASFFNGVNKASVTKAIAHGLSRATIQKLRYGTGKGAFLSGFVSSGFSVGGGKGATGAFQMAIVGGTVSAIGGGKFANGAMGSAFQYLFNDLVVAKEFEEDYLKISENELGAKMLTALENSKETYYIKKAGSLLGGVSEYRPNDRTIYITPNVKILTYGDNGFTVYNSDTVLFHEVSHAYSHMIGGDYRNESNIINNYEQKYTGESRSHWGIKW